MQYQPVSQTISTLIELLELKILHTALTLNKSTDNLTRWHYLNYPICI